MKNMFVCFRDLKSLNLAQVILGSLIRILQIIPFYQVNRFIEESKLKTNYNRMVFINKNEQSLFMNIYYGIVLYLRPIFYKLFFQNTLFLFERDNTRIVIHYYMFKNYDFKGVG